eukprot:scaffold11.g3900.t1
MRMSAIAAVAATEKSAVARPPAPKSLHGFELQEEQYVAECDSQAGWVVLLYRHAKTGAQVISVLNSDENKTFGATFRTPVADSKGTPHILEHSVLCGSRKYPIKASALLEIMRSYMAPCGSGAEDMMPRRGMCGCARAPGARRGAPRPSCPRASPLHPFATPPASALLQEPFVELMKGSLNTFLNAFTYPDRTCYPVASTNLQARGGSAPDFYNLVDVYLDAVLHPNCVADPRIFAQEGWHYELDAPQDPLAFKGVVFNEMKGVYSSPDSVNGRVTQHALFPNNRRGASCYAEDSGGDPCAIPELTFEEFQKFYLDYYHPSNARFWFYGDDPADERLAILDRFLSDFGPAPVDSAVRPQPLFAEPRRVVERYAAGEGADDGGEPKAFVSLNWVLSEEHLDLETELALSFLNHLLLGTPAAPLRKALNDSGLGESLIGGGLEDELRQPIFSVGLKGVKEEDADKVEALIWEELGRLEREGFSASAVEAAVNTIEFSLRENNTGSLPRGLTLMLRSMAAWIYDRDPVQPMRWQDDLEKFKGRLAAGEDVFGPLIRKYLLDNTHRVTVELRPDVQLAQEIEATEAARLKDAQARGAGAAWPGFCERMGPGELEAVAAATKELKERQETPDPPEAVACIPSLQLSDIPPEISRVPTARADLGGGATLLSHDLFTNDILYLDAALDMRSLPADLLPLVPLFCRCLTGMGTDKESTVEFIERIGRKTGGVSVSSFVSSVRGSPEPAAYLMLRGKAMADKAGDLMDIARDVLLRSRLDDRERFRQMVLETKAGLEAGIVGSGNSFAGSRLDGQRSVAGWANEQMGGLAYLEFIRGLVGRVESDWEGVQVDLERIRRVFASHRQGALVNLTGDERTLSLATPEIRGFLDSLPPSVAAGGGWRAELARQNEALVNYVCKAANLYEDAGYDLSGSSYVISKLLGTSWLWDRVRVVGGAYGGFCDFDTHSGMFTYSSYRDPNLLPTLDAYDGTVDYLRGLHLTSDELTKSIIGTIGDIDAYQLPDAKGRTAFMRHILGITDEQRQQRRDEVLSTSLGDFHAFADVLAAVRDQGQVVVVTNAERAEAANKERPGLFAEVKKAQLGALPKRMRDPNAKQQQEAEQPSDLAAQLGEVKKAAKTLYDRVYYGDVLPPIGSYQLSYARLLQLLHDRRVKRLVLLGDGRAAIAEVPVENTESDFSTMTYDRRDLVIQYAEEQPEWRMEKNRYYVELPGDVWEEGSLLRLIKENQEQRVWMDGRLRVPYSSLLQARGEGRERGRGVNQVRPELQVVDPGDAYVWLNQYSSQFLPILGLLALRAVVGAGEKLLRRFGKPKKSEQEQLAEQLGAHRAKEFNVAPDATSTPGARRVGGKKASKRDTGVRYADVAGIDRIKDDIKEVLDILLGEERYVEMGAHPVRGVLLEGPPGTGKTLLAKAMAGEAGVPFFSANGAEFVEMFQGVAAARIRSLFRAARKNAPAIIFIDEIDAIGKARTDGPSDPGTQEREQGLLQLLTEMDGFYRDDRVLIVAATNRADALDEALLRPGRFDRAIYMGRPNAGNRLRILQIRLGLPHAPIPNSEAKRRYAAVQAARAVAFALTPGLPPIEHVTIRPRGGAAARILFVPYELRKDGGMWHQLAHPDKQINAVKLDRPLTQFELVCALMTPLYAARVAEEVLFGADAASLLTAREVAKAGELARWIVVDSKLHPAFQDMPVLTNMSMGREEDPTTQYWAAPRYDWYIRQLQERAYARAQELIHTRRPVIEQLGQELLASSTETVQGNRIVELLEGTRLAPAPQPSVAAAASGDTASSSGDGAGSERAVLPVDQPTAARVAFGRGPGRSGAVAFARTLRLAPSARSAAGVVAGLAADDDLRRLAEVVMGRLEDVDLLPGSVALSKAEQVRQQLLDPTARQRLESVARFYDAVVAGDGDAPFPDPPAVPAGRPANTSLDGWATPVLPAADATVDAAEAAAPVGVPAGTT